MQNSLFVKIVAWLFVPSLIIALMLKFTGVDSLKGEEMRLLLNSINQNFVKFKLVIPSIPSITNTAYQTNDILKLLTGLANGVIGFINFLVGICNFIVQLVEFSIISLTTITNWVGSRGFQLTN